MHRRFFVLSACAAALPIAAQASYPAEPFSPQIWRDLRDAERVVIYNYRASWSLTCQIKADLIAEALAETPAYRSLIFVDVDWDTFARAQLTERLKVQRRSTLLLMRGGTELARLENEPYAHRVRALLDKALAAQ